MCCWIICTAGAVQHIVEYLWYMLHDALLGEKIASCSSPVNGWKTNARPCERLHLHLWSFVQDTAHSGNFFQPKLVMKNRDKANLLPSSVNSSSPLCRHHTTTSTSGWCNCILQWALVVTKQVSWAVGLATTESATLWPLKHSQQQHMATMSITTFHFSGLIGKPPILGNCCSAKTEIETMISLKCPEPPLYQNLRGIPKLD